MPDIFQRDPIIREIQLEPVASKGELVAGDWWEPAETKRVPWLRQHWMVIVFLVLPVGLASLYFGFIVSDQYVSETRFTVRSTGSDDVGNLAALMQSQKLSRAVDETYAVNDYVVSRDAVDLLVRDHNLRAILSRPEADIFNRFPNFYSRDNKEQLYRRFKRSVDTDIDTDSGISTLDVRAFTPEDARDLAAALLRSGETLVNRLNARAHEDALKLASQALDEAKARVTDVEMRLTKFRNDQNVIDPNREADAALDALAKMTTDLVRTKALLGQQIATAPQSPMIAPMREKIISSQLEIDKQRAQLVGSSEAMASKLAEFDELTLDRELAAKTLEAAANQYENARQEAEHQQLYLETIVEPNLADQPLYPKRILSILFVFGISLCVYYLVKGIVGTISEHQA
ncbi:MAG TPA: capsule biosynthesis protein [Methylocella sp.]|nr:capsule biosynthesis protein [Methylocella sp.]